jgi:hypothetical protein
MGSFIFIPDFEIRSEKRGAGFLTIVNGGGGSGGVGSVWMFPQELRFVWPPVLPDKSSLWNVVLCKIILAWTIPINAN